MNQLLLMRFKYGLSLTCSTSYSTNCLNDHLWSEPIVGKGSITTLIDEVKNLSIIVTVAKFGITREYTMVSFSRVH